MSLVLNYTQAKKVFEKAKADQFAMPAVNVTTSNTINATLEAAKNVNSPVIIQFSNSGASFFIGKSIANNTQQASIAGAAGRVGRPTTQRAAGSGMRSSRLSLPKPHRIGDHPTLPRCAIGGQTPDSARLPASNVGGTLAYKQINQGIARESYGIWFGLCRTGHGGVLRGIRRERCLHGQRGKANCSSGKGRCAVL